MTITIKTYLDDGRVFQYDIKSDRSEDSQADLAARAREHTHAIVANGYRSCRTGELTHYPPHRILKVKAIGEGIDTQYPDNVYGT